MNYLDSLSYNEKFLIANIVEYWNNCSSHSIDSDNNSIEAYGLPFCDLVFKIAQHRTSVKIENISYKIDLDGGQVDFYQFFEKNVAIQSFGDLYIDKIKSISIDNTRTFIIAANFLNRLYNDGLIYFEYENYDHSSYEEWDSQIDEFPAPKYIYHSEYFFSRKIAQFLDSFLGSPIIPSSQLIDLFNSKFETQNQIRYKKSQRVSKCGIVAAILIALFSPRLMTKFSKTSIEPAQLNTIINAIPKQLEEVKFNQEQLDSIFTILNKKRNQIMNKLKMQTRDVVGGNIEKIAALFPLCVTERLNKDGKPELAIDFDKLNDHECSLYYQSAVYIFQFLKFEIETGKIA